MKSRAAISFTFLGSAVFFLGACAENKLREIPEKEMRAITERNFSMDASFPPIDDFSVKETIEHEIAKSRPRLDLQNLRYYNRRIVRSDLLPLETDAAMHINDLVISNLQLDDVGIEPIRKLNLKYLDLGYNPVSNLHAIRGMKTLERLNLSFTLVGTEGMKVIATLVKMKELRLCGAPISDKDLLHLQSLKGLSAVALGECKNLTPVGIKRLKQALPHCRIDTKPPTVFPNQMSLQDVKVIRNTLMRASEFGEADLALQKFISEWETQKSVPPLWFAEAYRSRGECQKFLKNFAVSREMYLKSIQLFEKHSPNDIMLREVRSEYAAMLDMQQRLEAERKR